MSGGVVLQKSRTGIRFGNAGGGHIVDQIASAVFENGAGHTKSRCPGIHDFDKLFLNIGDLFRDGQCRRVRIIINQAGQQITQRIFIS